MGEREKELVVCEARLESCRGGAHSSVWNSWRIDVEPRGAEEIERIRLLELPVVELQGLN